MVIKEQRHGAVTIVCPEGPIAGDDVEAFRKAVETLNHRTLGRCVIDLSATPFVDSKALEALLDISDSFSESGHVLRLCGVRDIVQTILQMTGLADRFDQFEDANAAVRSFL